MPSVTCFSCGAQVAANPGALIRCPRCGNTGIAPVGPQAVVVHAPRPRRSILLAYVLWFFFGLFGVHRFYMGHTAMGIVYLLTGALCGLGWLLDLFLIPFSMGSDE